MRCTPTLRGRLPGVRATHGFAMQAVGGLHGVSELGVRLGVSKQAATKTAASWRRWASSPAARARRTAGADLTPTPHGREMLQRSAASFPARGRASGVNASATEVDATGDSRRGTASHEPASRSDCGGALLWRGGHRNGRLRHGRDSAARRRDRADGFGATRRDGRAQESHSSPRQGAQLATRCDVSSRWSRGGALAVASSPRTARWLHPWRRRWCRRRRWMAMIARTVVARSAARGISADLGVVVCRTRRCGDRTCRCRHSPPNARSLRWSSERVADLLEALSRRCSSSRFSTSAKPTWVSNATVFQRTRPTGGRLGQALDRHRWTATSRDTACTCASGERWASPQRGRVAFGDYSQRRQMLRRRGPFVCGRLTPSRRRSGYGAAYSEQCRGAWSSNWSDSCGSR